MTSTTTYATDPAICCTTADSPETERSTVSSSCCATPTSVDSPSAIDVIKAQDVPPEVASVRSAGFSLLLDTGQRVEREDWAAAADMTTAELQEVLDRPNVSGRVELDGEGRLLGIAGLTVEPTRHEVTVDGATRWTWCALDAVGILGALEADGTIRSTNPQNGDPIEIAFAAGEPNDEAVLFILGGYDGTNVREDWCPLVNFFTNKNEADAWISENGLDGDVVSISELAQDAAAMWRPVTDSASPQVC